MKKLLLILLLIPNLVMADVNRVELCESDCSNCKTFQDRQKNLRAFQISLKQFLAKTYENRAYTISEVPLKLQRLSNLSGNLRFQEFEIEEYYEYKKVYQELTGLTEDLPIKDKTQKGVYNQHMGEGIRGIAIDSLFRCAINDK